MIFSVLLIISETWIFQIGEKLGFRRRLIDYACG